MTGLSRFIFGRIELVEEEVMTMVEQNAFLDKAKEIARDLVWDFYQKRKRAGQRLRCSMAKV